MSLWNCHNYPAHCFKYMNNVYYATRKDFVSFAIKKIINNERVLTVHGKYQL